jgi:hypothetical protein
MSAQAEEVVASAGSLAQMSLDLEALVARFNLESGRDLTDKFGAFRKAHVGWISRLERMLAGVETISASQAGASRDCALGKWFYGSGQLELGSNAQFRALEQPHIRFHNHCKTAVESHSRGQADSAAQAVSEASRESQLVVGALDALERTLAAQSGIASVRDAIPAQSARRRAA